MAGRKPKMMRKGGAMKPKGMRKGGVMKPKGMRKGGAPKMMRKGGGVKKSKNGANGGSMTVAKARAFLKDQGYKVSRIS
tara:strand:- start:1620 stop:1856 length:237 start_codon:yes stop_codon:yes gene_type:complete